MTTLFFLEENVMFFFNIQKMSTSHFNCVRTSKSVEMKFDCFFIKRLYWSMWASLCPDSADMPSGPVLFLVELLDEVLIKVSSLWPSCLLPVQVFNFLSGFCWCLKDVWPLFESCVFEGTGQESIWHLAVRYSENSDKNLGIDRLVLTWLRYILRPCSLFIFSTFFPISNSIPIVTAK